MAEERRLSIRLGVDGADEVKRELDEIAKKGEASLGSIGQGSAESSRGVVDVGNAVRTTGDLMQDGIIRAAAYAAAIKLLGTTGVIASAGISAVQASLFVLPLALGAATAAATAFFSVVAVGNKEFADWERSILRTESILKATGNAVGRTTGQLDALATSVERTTLFDGDAAQDAIGQLLTFRTVQGETFEQAIRLSADLAEVFGGGLTQNATRLGKALEDPIQGITALRRVGVSFTATEREKIKALVESGQAAQAQLLILEKLELQVGGAASGANQGTAGAFKSLTDQIKEFNERMGEAVNLAGLFRTVAGQIEAARIDLFPTTEERIGKIDAGSGVSVVDAIPGIGTLSQLRRAVDLLVRRPALERQLGEEQDFERIQQAVAQARSAKAQRNIRAEEIFGIGSSAEEALVGIAATERDKIIREFEADVRKIENLKQIVIKGQNGAPDRIEFVDDAEVEKAIESITRLKDARLADIDAAERQANLAFIEGLRSQLNVAQIERRFAGDPRSAFVETQVAGLAPGRSEADAAAVRSLAAALFDETEALRSANEERERRTRNLEADTQLVSRLQAELALAGISDPVEQAVARARSQASDTASPQVIAQIESLTRAIEGKRIAEEKAAEVARLHAGAVTEIERALLATLPPYQAAIAEAEAWKEAQLSAINRLDPAYEQLAAKVEEVYQKRIAEANREALRASQSFEAGIIRGLENVATVSGDVGALVENGVGRAFQTLEDSIVNAVQGGETALDSLRQTLIAVREELIRLLVRQALIQPLAGGLLGVAAPQSTGGAFGFGGGGALGTAGLALGALSNFFPGFDKGGPVIDSPLRARDGGLMIKAHRGEGVLNQRAMENLGRMNRGDLMGGGGPSRVIAPIYFGGEKIDEIVIDIIESRRGKRAVSQSSGSRN